MRNASASPSARVPGARRVGVGARARLREVGVEAACCVAGFGGEGGQVGGAPGGVGGATAGEQGFDVQEPGARFFAHVVGGREMCERLRRSLDRSGGIALREREPREQRLRARLRGFVVVAAGEVEHGVGGGGRIARVAVRGEHVEPRQFAVALACGIGDCGGEFAQARFRRQCSVGFEQRELQFGGAGERVEFGRVHAERREAFRRALENGQRFGVTLAAHVERGEVGIDERECEQVAAALERAARFGEGLQCEFGLIHRAGDVGAPVERLAERIRRGASAQQRDRLVEAARRGRVVVAQRGEHAEIGERARVQHRVLLGGHFFRDRRESGFGGGQVACLIVDMGEAQAHFRRLALRGGCLREQRARRRGDR
jgi:hypothetical protein